MEMRPGYKKTEIGVIPEDWDAVTLGSIGESLIGLTYAPTDVRRSGILVLRSSNIQNDALAFEDNVFVERRIPAKIMVVPGDVLICVRNGSRDLIGKAALLDSRTKGMTFGAFMAVFRSGFGALVNYNFQSDILKRQINEHLGATINQITNKSLNSFRIPVPRDADELRAIKEALSDVDDSIAALSRLIAKKRDLRQGAMQRLLTGQTRLPGFTAPWQEKRLGDHVTFLKNGIQSRAQLTLDDPVRYLHYGDIHVSADIFLNLRENAIPRLPLKAAGLTRLQDGDVIFVDASEDLNGVGKSLEVTGAQGIEAVSGQHTIAARFDKSVLADGYKCYLQFMPPFTAHLRRLAAGTKVYATNRKHIASAELRLPEPDEQVAIARVLSDTGAEIAALDARLDKTRALKQAMMQALLTGRVRLPVTRDAAPQTKEAAHV
jgi:type I restriction enzyme S subunit